MKLQELLAGVAVQSRTAAPELEIGDTVGMGLSSSFYFVRDV